MPCLIPDDGTCLITHRGCLDGTGCALAFLQAGGLKQNVIFLDPDLNGLDGRLPSHASKIWFADCCPKDLHNVATAGIDVIVFDHHITNIRRHSADGRCFFDEKMCGTSILSSFLPSDVLPPRFCKAIEDYDLGRFSNEDGLFLADLAACFADQLTFIAYLQGIGLELIFSDSSTIRLVQEFRDKAISEIDRSVQRSQRMDFMGIAARFTTSVRYNCNKVAEKILAECSDCDLVVLKDPNGSAVSLRSREHGCDCSSVAQMFGGGGHKRAAGFSIKGN